MKEWEGSELQLTSVKRGQMGAFMCIARNNVPPAVSRRIVLNVHCKFSTRRSILVLSKKAKSLL